MNVVDITVMSKSCKSAVMSVGPSRAAMWLGTAGPNRSISRKHMETMKAAMLGGRWVGGLTSIHFDPDGHLMNGQHRLTAIVESGTTQIMDVRLGVPLKSRVLLDIGKRRSLTDTLQFCGAKNVSVSAATVGLAWAVDTLEARSTLHASPPNDIGMALYLADRDAFDMAAAMSVKHRLGFMTSKMTSWLAYVTEGESCEWSDRVTAAANLRSGTGAAILHWRLISSLGKRAVLPFSEAFPLVVKAYLADRQGLQMRNLHMGIDEALPALGRHGPRLGKNKYDERPALAA